MPRLIFPVHWDGLFVDVLIGLDGATTAGLVAAGQPVLAPIRAPGAIDTGSDVTAVNAAILQRLGVPPKQQMTTQTFAGSLGVNLFQVSLGISDFADPNAPELVESTLHVMEFTSALPKIEVVIGLDVLLKCRLVVDGPAGHFALEF
jgi:hypothetical protein